jgi:hypothetical protein
MAIINPVSYLHNRTDHTAQTDRLAESALLLPDTVGATWRSGVRGFSDLIVAAQGTPNMSVQVAAGQCFVNQSTAINGSYVVTNDASVTLSISAAHATLTRRDLIIAKVEDTFFTGGVDAGSLAVVVGTPSGSPVDPTVTGNYILLARVTVAPAVASITNAAITDLRQKTAALGGIIPVATTAERNALTAWRGRVVDNPETGFLERYNGSAWRQLREVDDTGWVNITLNAAWAVGSVTPAYRVKDGVCRLRGNATRASGSTATVFTLPVGARPTTSLSILLREQTTTILNASLATSGVLTIGTGYTNTDNVYFDSTSFMID